MPDRVITAPSASDDAVLRGRLVRLGVLPAAAAAVLFAVAIGYLWSGGVDSADIALIAAFVAGLLVIAVTAARAGRAARQADERIVVLHAEAAEARAWAADARTEANRAQSEAARAQAEANRSRADAGAGRADLEATRAELAKQMAEASAARAEIATARAVVAQAQAVAADAQTAAAHARVTLDLVREEADQARAEADQARAAAAEAVVLKERLREAESRPVAVRTQAGRQVEVFVNLSRRLQSLVHREIMLLDALENEVEDPDLLKGLFQVDHLATRIRRHAENLAVLGGTVSRRQWSRPVVLTEVLRSAIAEVEHYSRVKLVPPIEGTVPGHAVASIIHLVAELIENATMFAPPQTQVLLRAQAVAAGMVVEVEDRGLGIPSPDRERVNRLLADPDDVDLDELLQDGRIGLFVVSMIARQHGITVQLQSNIYGGTQAVVVLPRQLLGPVSEEGGTAVVQAAAPVSPAPTVRATARAQLTAPPPVWPAPAAPTPEEGSAPGSGEESDTDVMLLAGDAETDPADSPPPLPRRHSQTHLAPQLQAGPPERAADPDEDTEVHDPGLMASFLRGVSRGEAGEPAGTEPR
ncbi:sensor histidine kinase [Actinoplanes sp. RD1]|uniref:sensor histidine kinase n=1 Tax=Actinoplanes sp. RD1 TaxID=3064538 RepID=UPI00274257BE|nr:ATP-binding protein [Actinoplanes sp. RD1]